MHGAPPVSLDASVDALVAGEDLAGTVREDTDTSSREDDHRSGAIGLAAEWERVEVLARLLLEARAGRSPSPALTERLRELQGQVDALRADPSGPWGRLLASAPAPVPDLLACVYAAEVRPALAWLWQELLPGGWSGGGATSGPGGEAPAYPNVALLGQLLALGDDDLYRLRLLAARDGDLARERLIQVDGDGPFAPLKPNVRALALLTDRPLPAPVPPGAYPVRRLADWDDLVLPPSRERALREYLLWIVERRRVVDDWGGARCGGPVALFSGPSGTGKTFAAGIIARQLGWPLYRVDLARLVSKYVGETEKNLGRLFDAADGEPMVLQFDEVDALMSKRGEIKEARDRYANMEVSYLLARIEDHDGPCILTTNLRGHIDTAFGRRFQLVVEFPRPDVAARERLWRRMLPPRAPLAQDLDLGAVAAAVSLTGGQIRNAALHAAYLAAGSDGVIDGATLAVAVYRELAKERPQLATTDLGPLAPLLPEGFA